MSRWEECRIYQLSTPTWIQPCTFRLCTSGREEDSSTVAPKIGEKIINPENDVIFVREVKGGEENEVVTIGKNGGDRFFL